MKKFLIGFIVLFLLSFGFSQSLFEKAAQEELEKREDILQRLKIEIENHFEGIVSEDDAVVEGKEMKRLRELVKNFDKKKKKLDKELGFYEITTDVKLTTVIREHLKIFFKESGVPQLIFCDNKNEDIRRYWVQQVGLDVRVERAKNYRDIFAISLIIAIVLGFVCFGTAYEDNDLLTAIKYTISAVLVMFLVLGLAMSLFV